MKFNQYKITCPECKKENIILDRSRGELICQNCGMVISQKEIDMSPEWRIYSYEDSQKKNRVGPPTDYAIFDKNLGSIIDSNNKDIYGNRIINTNLNQIHRLRKWNVRAKINSSYNYNLSIAMITLDKITSQLGLPKLVKIASSLLYRKILKKKLVKGRSIVQIIIATIYLICRLYLIPIKLKELADHTNVEIRYIRNYYNLIIKKFDLKPNTLPITLFVSRYCSDLYLSNNVELTSLKILDIIEKRGLLIGKNPSSVIGAVIYTAAIINQERKTQKQISKVVGITESTIRELCRIINSNIIL
ncbi:MAG: transcription initiation factor IIB [Candidatus Lokiarchaeota archaeon]|nr:transcription initiation factor IIB [Candidatus Lokiarchaeota archaeon]